MKARALAPFALSLVALAPHPGPRGGSSGDGAAVQMEVRVISADAWRQASLRVEIEGGLFRSLGVPSGAEGSVRLEGAGGTATTPIVGELGDRPGVLTFRAAPGGPELVVSVEPVSGDRAPALAGRGRVVRVVRDEDGALRIETDGTSRPR